MNIHWLLGTICFVIWSAFSTWYYVTRIKDFDMEKTELITEIESVENQTNLSDVTTPTEPEREEPEKTIDPDTTLRRFSFLKNSTVPIALDQLNAFVDSIRSEEEVTSVVITGHTCNLGTEAYNEKLGMKRANYVNALLKMNDRQVFTKTQGETQPLVPNTSEKNRVINRRVDVQIISNL